MRNIRWTNEAIAALSAGSPATRDLLFERLELIAQFPAMYPVRQRGRFAGLRYFVPSKRWIVYYRPRDDDILFIAIMPALARPT